MSEKNTAKDQPDDKKSTKVKRERRVENTESREPERKTDDSPNPDAASKPRRKRGDANDNKSPEGDGGGWMSSSNNGGKSMKAKIKYDDDERDNATTAANKDKHFQDDNEEIMLIPDLDEEGGADSDQRIAHAPRNVNRRIPTLAELELEVKAALPNAEDGLNLNVLLNTLVPVAMVYEADVPWTFESLLREVTDELSNTPKTVISATITTPPPTVPPIKSNSKHSNEDTKSKNAIAAAASAVNNNNSSFMSAATTKAVKGK